MIREVGIDYCWKAVQNGVVRIRDKIITLARSNHRVCVSTKVMFSVLAVSSKVLRRFLLDRVRIKPFFKRTSIHHAPKKHRSGFWKYCKILVSFFVVVVGGSSRVGGYQTFFS